MVGHEGEAFPNLVLHYAASLHGTRQYWFKQRSRLIAIVDTLGLPTIFFTHSAADLQWPELAHLICPDNPECSSSRNKAVLENPAIADSSTIESRSSLKHSMLVYLVLLTTGCVLSGNIVAAYMCMAWLGFQVHLMWSR